MSHVGVGCQRVVVLDQQTAFIWKECVTHVIFAHRWSMDRQDRPATIFP